MSYRYLKSEIKTDRKHIDEEKDIEETSLMSRKKKTEKDCLSPSKNHRKNTHTYNQ